MITLPARIGIVTTSYPRWQGDAAGGFVAAHARALVRAGCTVEVIAAGEPAADLTRCGAPPIAPAAHLIASRLFYRGGASDALEAGAGGAAAVTARHASAAVFTVRQALAVTARGRRWDAAIAHWLAPSAIAALPARGPLLAIAHGGDVHLLIRTRLLSVVIALLAARRARVVFVSAELRARALAALGGTLARWLERASIVQAMGVDVERFARVAPPAGRTIAVLARLVPIKGVDVAIEAMRGVGGHARLVIAGAGPARAALEAHAQRVRAATGHGIELTGALDADRVDALLADASVVVVPSRPVGARAEGSPLVAVEALAAGRPVIAAATGGLAELGDPVRLVTPDDAGALGAAIEEVLRAPPSPEACRIAAAPRAWAAVADRLHHHWLGAQPVTQYASK